MQVVKFEAPELNAIEPSKAQQIKATFEPMAEMLSQFEEAYNEITQEAQLGITSEVTAKAKRLRLDIGKVRIETGKRKDKAKEYLKLEDKAIMGVHNILVYAVKEKEDKLKEIETYFETQERLRLEALQAERAERLSKYVEDANERDLAKFADDEFEALFQMKKREHEEHLEAMRLAEEERIAKEKAEAEERERMRLENERLRKEAEEREAQAQAERLAREEKERKEREAYEAKLRAEREEKERIQRELEQRAEAERLAKEQEEARIQAELSKGDSDKVSDLISDLQSLKTKYTFESDSNKKMYADVCMLLDKIVNHINK